MDPLFEQVFVVAVCSGSQCVDALVGELPAVGVDEHGHQAVQLPVQLVDLFHNLGHGGLERAHGEGSQMTVKELRVNFVPSRFKVKGLRKLK